MNKNLFLLWQGQIISQLGMQAYTIAMMFWLMASSGSSAAMSVIFALSTLPQIIFGPVAGVIADRHSNRRIIITCDLLRGSTVLMMTGVLFSGLFSTVQVVMLFGLTACINGGCKAFFQPAIDAWIPQLTPPHKLPKVMATFGATTQASVVLGQASAGMLFTMLGAPLLLLVDAVSYYLSAFSEFFIKQQPKNEGDKATQLTVSVQNYKNDLVTGWRYLSGTSGMLPAALSLASINFFLAPVMLLLPFYVAEQILAGAQRYGFLLASLALGSLLGYSFSPYLKIIIRKRSALMLFALHCFAFSLLVFSLSKNAYGALLSFFTAGICLGVFNLQGITLFQTAVEPAIRARVLSFIMTVSAIFLPLGSLAGGLWGELTSQDTASIFCTLALCLSGLTIGVGLSRKTTDFLDTEALTVTDCSDKIRENV